MAQKNEENINKSGFLLINKPSGLTSHDVVNTIRRTTGVKRVGHAGTLDPFATGLLIIGVGREATRNLGTFSGLDKEYQAVMRLGAMSDTQDLDGKIIETGKELPTEDQLQQIISSFAGEQNQIPPMYSAKKIKGQRLYQLARAGQEVIRNPVKIKILRLELDFYTSPLAGFTVNCSSGTYVRTLAHDIGQVCGCGAYLTKLHRTSIGTTRVELAHELHKITSENWIELLI